MIVWGGSTPLATHTGGRYDPANDKWSATSTGAGVPAARSHHVAVWTGTEMIVWGGDTNTGGRYAPATDTWVPTSTASGVPTARTLSTAVWTGTEMIVWGGSAGSGDPYTFTGGHYEPASDTWTPTSLTAGVPTGRVLHTAVWTGTEMIVWGGFNGLWPDTGGRYDPATATWTPTASADGVLVGREFFTGVWTGNEMIVWGGFGGFNHTGRLNDGAPYCACAGSEVSTWYPDADGDGYGVDSTGILSCAAPAGYVAVGDDCDDSHDAIAPGSVEINDGLDNQCPGDVGFGTIDEISGAIGFHAPFDRNTLSWVRQDMATGYQVARATDPQFAHECAVFSTPVARWTDAVSVPADTCFYYLVRSAQPHVGSWGAGSARAERTESCAAP
jgi:hypothetical protein